MYSCLPNSKYESKIHVLLTLDEGNWDSKLNFFNWDEKSGQVCNYSEVPNRRADQNKRAGLEESDTLLAYLLSKLINEQGGIFHFTK